LPLAVAGGRTIRRAVPGKQRAGGDDSHPSPAATVELLQQHGAKLYLDQVIAKKLEFPGVASTDVRASRESG
jgi:hypothetical protein